MRPRSFGRQVSLAEGSLDPPISPGNGVTFGPRRATGRARTAFQPYDDGHDHRPDPRAQTPG